RRITDAATRALVRKYSGLIVALHRMSASHDTSTSGETDTHAASAYEPQPHRRTNPLSGVGSTRSPTSNWPNKSPDANEHSLTCPAAWEVSGFVLMGQLRCSMHRRSGA